MKRTLLCTLLAGAALLAPVSASAQASARADLGNIVVGIVEVGITWSDLDNLITGDSNTGAITPALGYRFML